MTREAREFILAHAGEYDPRKRREYYLRTRQLKGRPTGTATPTNNPAWAGPSSNAARLKQARAKRVADLKARLERLEAVLDALMKEVKAKREGSSKGTSPTKSSSSTSSGGSDRKLTAKQKREAAERSRKYREENKEPKSETAEQIEAKIAEVRKKIAEMKAQIAAAKRKQASGNRRISSTTSANPSASGR